MRKIIYKLFPSSLDKGTVKSALSTQVLEGTVTEWPLRSLTGITLGEISESDGESSDTEVWIWFYCFTNPIT